MISMQSYITCSLLTLPIDIVMPRVATNGQSCYNLRVRTVADVEVNLEWRLQLSWTCLDDVFNDFHVILHHIVTPNLTN